MGQPESQRKAVRLERAGHELPSSLAFIQRLGQKLAAATAFPLGSAAEPPEACPFCARVPGEQPRVVGLLSRRRTRGCATCDFYGHYSQ